MRDLELVDIRPRIVLGIRDCRLEHFTNDDRAALRAELQDVERVLDAFPANEIRDKATLLGREPHAAQFCCCVHIRPYLAAGVGLAFLSAAAAEPAFEWP